ARLLHLAPEGALVADVELADELLRDRRAALDDLARADVLPRGAGDALVVDAAVLVEAPVLDRDRRARHPGRDLRERHGLALALAVAVPGEEIREVVAGRRAHESAPIAFRRSATARRRSLSARSAACASAIQRRTVMVALPARSVTYTSSDSCFRASMTARR